MTTTPFSREYFNFTPYIFQGPKKLSFLVFLLGLSVPYIDNRRQKHRSAMCMFLFIPNFSAFGIPEIHSKYQNQESILFYQPI